MRKIAICLIFISFLVYSIIGNNLPANAQVSDRKKQDFNKEKIMRFQSGAKTDLGKVKDRQVIIKFKDVKTIQVEDLGCEHVFTPDVLKKRALFVARIPDSFDYDEKIRDLNAQGHIEYATPNYLSKPSLIPGDEFFSRQWYLPMMNPEWVRETFFFSVDLRRRLLHVICNSFSFRKKCGTIFAIAAVKMCYKKE